MQENELDIVAEYHRLGKLERQLKERRAILKQKIQDRYLHFHLRGGGGFWSDYKGDYTVSMQRRKNVQYDELALETLITERGLWDKCKKEVVDPDLVQQAYIEGDLTDSDLRSVYVNGGVTYALKVEEVKEDVQADDEGVREGGGTGALHDWALSEAAEEVSRDVESLGETEGHS